MDSGTCYMIRPNQSQGCVVGINATSLYADFSVLCLVKLNKDNCSMDKDDCCYAKDMLIALLVDCSVTC